MFWINVVSTVTWKQQLVGVTSTGAALTSVAGSPSGRWDRDDTVHETLVECCVRFMNLRRSLRSGEKITLCVEIICFFLFRRNTTITYNHQHHNMATCFGLFWTIFRPVFSSRRYSRCALCVMGSHAIVVFRRNENAFCFEYSKTQRDVSY